MEILVAKWYCKCDSIGRMRLLLVSLEEFINDWWISWKFLEINHETVGLGGIKLKWHYDQHFFVWEPVYWAD